jgi:hypothetical protein
VREATSKSPQVCARARDGERPESAVSGPCFGEQAASEAFTYADGRELMSLQCLV